MSETLLEITAGLGFIALIKTIFEIIRRYI